MGYTIIMLIAITYRIKFFQTFILLLQIQVGIRKSVQNTTPAYRSSTPQSSAYRSPSDINIPLQQRRPQIIFTPTTARYEEEEYNYEKK